MIGSCPSGWRKVEDEKMLWVDDGGGGEKNEGATLEKRIEYMEDDLRMLVMRRCRRVAKDKHM